MNFNKELENLCYAALEKGPKKKYEINEFVVNSILHNDLSVGLIYSLNNLGFRLESLKKKGLVTNTANCKDANEGLHSRGTWFIKEK